MTMVQKQITRPKADMPSKYHNEAVHISEILPGVMREIRQRRRLYAS